MENIAITVSGFFILMIFFVMGRPVFLIELLPLIYGDKVASFLLMSCGGACLFFRSGDVRIYTCCR